MGILRSSKTNCVTPGSTPFGESMLSAQAPTLQPKMPVVKILSHGTCCGFRLLIHSQSEKKVFAPPLSLCTFSRFTQFADALQLNHSEKPSASIANSWVETRVDFLSHDMIP